MHELISTTSGLILYKYLISFVLLGAISTVALIVWYVVRRSFYEVYGDELETITQERSRTQVKKKRRAKSRKKELPDGMCLGQKRVTTLICFLTDFLVDREYTELQ